jgi:hypothetical protein
MYRNRKLLLSIKEIERIYPNEWVALAVSETDAHGFATAGEVMLHSSDEQFVWRTVGREDVEEPVYVFFSGATRNTVAA